MKQQFINITPEPEKSQGASTNQPVDAQNAGAPHQGSLFKAPFMPSPPHTPTELAGEGNDASPPSQFKKSLTRPPLSLAPEMSGQNAPRPTYVDPGANMYGQVSTDIAYTPVIPGMNGSHLSPLHPPFQRAMTANTSMPASSVGFFPAPPAFAPPAFAPASEGFFPAPPAFAPAPPAFAPAPPAFAPAPPAFAPAPPAFAPAPPAFAPMPQGYAPATLAPTPLVIGPSGATQARPNQTHYYEGGQGRAGQWPQNLPITSPQSAPQQNVYYQSSAPWDAPGPYTPRPQARYGQQHTPPPMAMPAQLKYEKKRGMPIWSRVLLGTLAVFLIFGGSAYAYYQVNYASSINNITNQQVVHHNAKGEVVATPQANVDVLTGNRLNILLLGSDTDGKTIPLAQTDIIISIDPQTKYVGMLSIPRDLRLYAPKAGAIKLDEAFSTGWALPGNNNYGNAVGLSIDTIQQNFGIPINYSAWVGLDGFVKVIDTAGGVDVDVLHPMVDDIYPNDVNNKGGQAFDYKRLYIAPGPQHLDGIHALEYVRTRHSDGQADFGRAVRQQQILSQLKNKLTQIDLNKIPELVQDLNGHVKTDIQITDLPKLANFAKGIDPNKIDRLVLSQPYSVPASTVFPKDTTTDYIPVCSQILPKIQQMFALGDKATCPTVGARYTFPQTALAPTTTASGQLAVTQSKQDTQGRITTADAWQMIGAAAPASIESTSKPVEQVSANVRSLLDLMLMTVFQSFDVSGK